MTIEPVVAAVYSPLNQLGSWFNYMIGRLPAP